MIVHPLHVATEEVPTKLNNPFCYQPSPLMCKLAEKLRSRLPSYEPGRTEGKMFGLLIVEKDGEVGYLQAYSGQMDAEKLGFIGIRAEEWAPMVLDYLQPDGYFMRHEADIDSLNAEIQSMEHSPRLIEARQEVEKVKQEAESALAIKRKAMTDAKAERDRLRNTGKPLSEEAQQAMTRESQYLKAELHREKLKWREASRLASENLEKLEQQLHTLKERRSQMSDHLQQWLFAQFRFRCANGSDASLAEIFSPAVPPSGAGECCEPKLLDYAFRHNMRPVEMATFWWGDPPQGEIRRHGSFYPACRGKCRPILLRMLRDTGIDLSDTRPTATIRLKVLYEDQWLAVVDKPDGVLSVPGKSEADSVQEALRRRWHLPADTPLLPHRLDMATSGLMVAARSADVFKQLQQQFAGHTIRKVYSALLPLDETADLPTEGTIDLPLRPDIEDRPRQMVDKTFGRKAVTEYKLTGHVVTMPDGRKAAEVLLSPLTGRTHQLRVHCAYTAGLGTPIIGDPLYGDGRGRLCLHAMSLEFTHPVTLRRMKFRDPAPWSNK